MSNFRSVDRLASCQIYRHIVLPTGRSISRIQISLMTSPISDWGLAKLLQWYYVLEYYYLLVILGFSM